MAIDRKYGRVTVEHTPGNPLGEDEPVVVFRARDQELPRLLRGYWKHCAAAGSPYQHLEMIREAEAFVSRWQRDNPDLVKVPD